MWPLVCLLMTLAATNIQHAFAHTSTENMTLFRYYPVVQSPPKITLAPKSQKVAEDGTASFFCKASGNPAPSIAWEKRGKTIVSRRTRYEIVDVPHMSVLRIKPVRAAREDGLYTCVATNSLGEARANATLYVYKKDEVNGGGNPWVVTYKEFPSGYPRILLHPKLKSVEKGLSTIMQCEAAGEPDPTIMWLKDYVPVDLSDPRIQLLESGYLQIHNSQESDEATYECLAENELGVAYSYPAMMYVKVRRVPPRFSILPEDQNVMPGSDVNLTCVAVGSPMPLVKWRQGAYDLTDEDNVPVGKNVLELKDVRESKNYTCEASSDLGNIEHVVQVIVEAPGTPPRNIRARAASSTTIVVSWDEPEIPNGIIQGYKVFYTLKPEDPVFFWEQQEVKNDNRLTTISGLEPNQTYTISILAYSSIGPGPMSHPIQVLTTQGAGFQVPYQPLNLHAEAISPNEIVVKWDAPQEADSIISYELYYNDSHTRQNVRFSIHPPVSSYRLEDLTPDTVYHIQVSAKSSRGEGPRTPTVQVKTHAFVPGEPRKVKVEAINSTGIFVEWTEPKEPNGKIRGYQVYYIEVNSNDEPIPGRAERYHDTFSGSTKEAVITGLDPDTRYLIQVAGYTRKGDGMRSNPRIITTKGAVPTPPRNLHVNLIQEDPPSVKVTWQRPRDTYGSLENYKIIWGPQGERYEEKIMSADVYSYVTSTLDRGTTYEFRVSAKNNVDYGERAVDTIRTPDGAPSGAPQNFTATGLTETSVRLTWDLPARNLRNGDIVMYQITYHKLADAINEEDLNITDTFVDIVGLEMDTDYIFKIKAYTSRGAGPWSNRLHFRTFGRMPPPPQNVKVRRTSSTSIEVTWDEPNFPVAGYKIYYNMFATPAMYVWQQMETGPYTVADIGGLEPHTVYAVRVQAKSVDGRFGNLSETVTTDVKEVQRDNVVQNFHVTQRLTNLVRLSWSPSEKPGVNIYLLKYSGVKTYRENGQVKQINQDPQEVRIPGQMTSWTVKNLQPKMKFEFNISVIFQDGETGPDVHITTETLINAPPYVEAPVVSAVEGGTIVLKLERASEKNGPISHYHIVVVPLKSGSVNKMPSDFTMDDLIYDNMGMDKPASRPYIAARFEAQALPPQFYLGNGQEYGAFVNRPLDKDDKYRVFLRAYSVDPRLYKSSDYSDEIDISGVSGSSNVRTTSTAGSNGSGKVSTLPRGQEVQDFDEKDMLLTIVAPTCSGAVLIICICAAITYLMMRRKNKSKSVMMEPEAKALMVDVPPYLVDPVEMRRQHYQTPAMISHPPIPIERLGEHIEMLKAADNLKFSQEYESIEPGQQFTWDNSNLEVNKPKNRYANVIAYDHSRVILQPIDGVPGSDYINANYMDGYRKQNAYIATQGPLPETFGDFWRMVWEQRSATVVMMTKLEERSRIKCDQYWPSRGAETYGLMHVQLVEVTELATYTIRTFHLSRYGCPEKREVRQFQFTAWPDHGVPDHPTPLLMFMRRVKVSNPPDTGSMIVHCSAGVGRTGAFIVIDAMLERIKHEKTVDIYGHVTCLRAQRNYMVQTEDQYIFIHDALLEAVQCGNTEVPARNLAAHIQKLTQPEPGETVTGMELEFKRLANVKASPNRFISANLPVNKFKNRLVNILPYESTRVCLQPIRGVDGSDYINASFIDGYRYKKAYVATQGPLAETTEDFWRMLWEHNSTIIVMLTKLREMGREKCHQYWPSERSARYQYFVVDPMTEYNMPQYILREFKVTDARDGQSRTIRQFQFTDWPEQGVPKSGEGFIDFIGQVHKTKEQFGQEGPITVHCSAGVGRTGVFITLSIVLERMRYEGVVDMFQTVKMLRTQRPAMVQTEDQFQFCYRAALEYLGSFDHYAN
ncbi:receptor-type tyrosine-protein phosphatase S-like isoform X6 [Pomacea canaliculata]|uniref:receptor-type tyrosine-protein phosphatase S-like isoform X6 n=1 Tax=Pomacea canaliculata TaxID=400727 RepID=UPI000D7357CE|nr:receptor-type tyrosine-protein phosphatase S-like isoform X6 [Pomacea canaliculata]